MKDEFRDIKTKLLSGRFYPEFFTLNSNDRVINIGCGKGPQAILYAGQYKEMLGVDINRKRLNRSRKVMEFYDVKNYETMCADVEKLPLKDRIFDKAIAIAISEHVQHPEQLCKEAYRVLKPDGELLITFPAIYDEFKRSIPISESLKNIRTAMPIIFFYISTVGRLGRIRKKTVKVSKEWNPDAHNQERPLKQWIKIVENEGFKLQRSRAASLFPPLHLFGVPKFWFSNNFIYKIDSMFCKLTVIRNFGQALVCIFIKEKSVF